MSRSGYNDDCDGDQWSFALWRGNVANAIRGKRGQAFLRELIASLDALPSKQLIRGELKVDAPEFIPPEFAQPQVCAIGSVGLRRNVEMGALDPHDSDRVAEAFGIAHQMVREIEYENDERGWRETTEQRWHRMREWAVRNLKDATP